MTASDTAAERRRYALLQAAAVIYSAERSRAGALSVSEAVECIGRLKTTAVDDAEDLLAKIERREEASRGAGGGAQ